MAGVQGDALLDFAGGLFESQVQALRHERILRTRGRIDFLDGTPPLDLRGREITRLSVTLLDHGALQDRMVLWGLYRALIGMTVQATPGYNKISQVEKFDRSLTEMRTEVAALEALDHSVQRQALTGASLSVGSLAVLLGGVGDLAQFVERIATPGGFMSFNPIFEFYRRLKAGHVR
jgi:hypothetical protein